jgi:glycosyltransferase involved in cell wall biosynthesis
LITHQKNGLLCDPGDPESLRQQLEWVQANPARAARLGHAGRQTVEQYSWDACAEGTLRIYEKVVGTRV